MTLYEKIRKARCEYEGLHSDTATRLYLGYEEWMYMKNEAGRGAFGPLVYDPALVGKRAKFDGLDIYQVIADSHLAVS